MIKNASLNALFRFVVATHVDVFTALAPSHVVYPEGEELADPQVGTNTQDDNGALS